MLAYKLKVLNIGLNAQEYKPKVSYFSTLKYKDYNYIRLLKPKDYSRFGVMVILNQRTYDYIRKPYKFRYHLFLMSQC